MLRKFAGNAFHSRGAEAMNDLPSNLFSFETGLMQQVFAFRSESSPYGMYGVSLECVYKLILQGSLY